MTYLEPSESFAYENRRRRARDTYQVGVAGLESQRSNTLQNEGLATSDLSRKYTQMRERLPGSFVRRGVMDSGIYKRGLERYAQARQGDQANLSARYQQMLSDLALQGQAQGVNYSNTLGAVDDEEAARRAQLAAALKGLL